MSKFIDDLDLVLKIDGHDNACIGHTVNESNTRLIYCMDKIIENLVEGSLMDRIEAEEYFWFNIAGSYVGPNTPIIMDLDLGEHLQHLQEDAQQGEGDLTHNDEVNNL
jgi:hypothetical protein